MSNSSPASPASPSEWMTLQECARELKVDVEVIRRWCLAFESGDVAGLPSSHFGVELDEAKIRRRLRRIHVEDWKAFKDRQRHGPEKREPRQFERVPRERPIRPSAIAAARGLPRGVAARVHPIHSAAQAQGGESCTP